MLLRVNPMVGIWGFASKEDARFELWFTLADPRPQNINVEELPGDLARAVQGALHTKALIEVSAKGEQLRRSTSQVLRPAVTELGVNPELEQKAKELLSGGVTSIRREVSMIKDSLILSVSAAVEKSQKNRKTVIDLLERQLLKTAKLRQAVLNGTGSTLEKQYAIDVEESDTEEVTLDAQGIHVEVTSPVLDTQLD